jgi:hypothetical protein
MVSNAQDPKRKTIRRTPLGARALGDVKLSETDANPSQLGRSGGGGTRWAGRVSAHAGRI